MLRSAVAEERSPLSPFSRQENAPAFGRANRVPLQPLGEQQPAGGSVAAPPAAAGDEHGQPRTGSAGSAAARSGRLSPQSPRLPLLFGEPGGTGLNRTGRRRGGASGLRSALRVVDARGCGAGMRLAGLWQPLSSTSDAGIEDEVNWGAGA